MHFLEVVPEERSVKPSSNYPAAAGALGLNGPMIFRFGAAVSCQAMRIPTNRITSPMIAEGPFANFKNGEARPINTRLPISRPIPGRSFDLTSPEPSAERPACVESVSPAAADEEGEGFVCTSAALSFIAAAIQIGIAENDTAAYVKSTAAT
jgi:hypothetical protein